MVDDEKDEVASVPPVLVLPMQHVQGTPVAAVLPPVPPPVCMDAPASFAFIPCGHRCVCEKCRDSVCALFDSRCPRCRESFSSTLRIYV